MKACTCHAAAIAAMHCTCGWAARVEADFGAGANEVPAKFSDPSCEGYTSYAHDVAPVPVRVNAPYSLNDPDTGTIQGPASAPYEPHRALGRFGGPLRSGSDLGRLAGHPLPTGGTATLPTLQRQQTGVIDGNLIVTGTLTAYFPNPEILEEMRRTAPEVDINPDDPDGSRFTACCCGDPYQWCDGCPKVRK